MPDEPTTKPEPQSFTDLAMQPTGSGVADEQRAFLEAAIEDAALGDGVDPGTGGDPASPNVAVVPTEGGVNEAESEAQPS